MTQAQRYVLRELQLMYREVGDDDLREQVKILEEAYRGSISAALNRELNLLRRNGVTGDTLHERLSQLYQQHNLREQSTSRVRTQTENSELPKIICSAALV